MEYMIRVGEMGIDFDKETAIELLKRLRSEEMIELMVQCLEKIHSKIMEEKQKIQTTASEDDPPNIR